MGRDKPSKKKRKRTDYWEKNNFMVTRVTQIKEKQKKVDREIRKLINQLLPPGMSGY